MLCHLLSLFGHMLHTQWCFECIRYMFCMLISWLWVQSMVVFISISLSVSCKVEFDCQYLFHISLRCAHNAEPVACIAIQVTHSAACTLRCTSDTFASPCHLMPQRSLLLNVAMPASMTQLHSDLRVSLLLAAELRQDATGVGAG